MTTLNAAGTLTTEFVRLGYAGASLDFRTQVRDQAEFCECMTIIGGYNRFSGQAAAKAIGAIYGDLMSVEVGRECSPVLYLHIPFWTGQRVDRDSRSGSEPIPEPDRVALVEQIRQIGRKLYADEFSIQTMQDDGGPVVAVRLWWD